MERSTQNAAWMEIREVLDRAATLPEGQRRELVHASLSDPELRDWTLAVLGIWESQTATLQPPPAQTGPRPSTYGPGDRIGPYRLEEQLGAGGMGTVFLATRVDDAYSANVAIKLSRQRWTSKDELDRFRRERQILADLKNPAIAGLLDGGTTEHGHSYLVMEFVEGRPLDIYVRERNPSLKERLELFLQICGAVQFAHQNLVVHRDLKPGNIMVTPDGAVKLMDFGIAKILTHGALELAAMETRPGSSPMTLAYASPEQIRGESITTATDVYALGILLYELLTGQRPYSLDSSNLSATIEAICDRDATAPSIRLRSEQGKSSNPGAPAWQTVQGDLDAITLKALAKEPARRYASAEQMAQDLWRFQRHEPVSARRGTWTYRSGKFLYRHRIALAAAAVILVALVESVLLLVQDRRRLVQERNTAEQVIERLTMWLEQPKTWLEQPTPGEPTRELPSLSPDLLTHTDDPELDAHLRAVLGRAYVGLGDCERAVPLLRNASAHLQSDSVIGLQSLTRLSWCYAELGRWQEAEAASAQAEGRWALIDGRNSWKAEIQRIREHVRSHTEPP